MRYLSFLLVSVIIFTGKTPATAQAPYQKSSAEIYQDLLRLNTLSTVLYVAAHPDDENTRLLSWLVGEKKFRTAYVSLTRGDGGQNLIGKELGTLLGAIRTQELLAARKTDGAEQYFTRAYDFGFSKNPEETLQKWNEDSILKDLVVLIRKIKPDVIISRFPHTGEGGHGHHTAAAILSRKAFELAADPAYQVTDNLPAWKVKRLFWNTFIFSSGANTTSEDQLKTDVGTFNPVLGVSYGEVASRSRSQHKSQGFGSASTRGSNKEYFVQWNGDVVKEDLFEGLNTSWSRIPGTVTIQSQIQKAVAGYKIEQPDATLPALLEIRKNIQLLQRTREFNPEKETWLKYKLKQIENLIAQCAGIWIVATVNSNELVPGDKSEVKTEWIHRSSLPVKLESVAVGQQLLAGDTIATRNELVSFTKNITIPEDVSYTAPYWLETPIQQDLFHPAKDINGNAAYINSNQIVKVRYSIQGQIFETELPLNYRFVDPVKGEIFQPVVFLPAVSMQWSIPFSIHPNGVKNQIILKVTAHTDIHKGKLLLDIPAHWKISVSDTEITTLKKGQSQEFTLDISTDAGLNTKDTLHAAVELDGKKYHLQLYNIDYEHIPRQTILTASQLPLTSFSVKTTAKKIGYIEGAGDMVAQSLNQLGYEIVYITENNFSQINWGELDAVVTGIRAYNTHRWLNTAFEPLMKYVENGGNLVVQYNTNNRIGPLVAKLFPYELEITRDRVTVEEAPVTFTDKNAVVLKAPNLITAEDFSGWVQERGIYFAGKRSEEWKGVLAMNDPNESVSEGSLMIASYGKGNLIYTGLAFFRQLPAGVSGAYRLFVNILEAPSE